MKIFTLIASILLFATLSCKEANPIIELPPIVEEEEVSIPTDTYCVIEEDMVSSEDVFYVHNTGGQEYGFATAIKLNKEWEGSAFAKFANGYLNVFMGSYDPFDPGITNVYERRESLGFQLSVVEKGCFVGTEEIENELNEQHAKFTYFTQRGDIGEDTYQLHVEDSKGNYLEIDSINLETKFISGYFMAGFNNTGSNQKEWNPDYVRFLNGRFECTIIE